jgi:hypothetical protein
VPKAAYDQAELHHCQCCRWVPANPITVAWPDGTWHDAFVCGKEECRKAVVRDLERQRNHKGKVYRLNSNRILT